MKKLISILALLYVAFLAQAATQINGIYYYLNSSTKTAEVTNNPNYYSGDVNIPLIVTYDGNTYSVTSIGSHAFRNCKGLTCITIPNSVTRIGNNAFDNCTNLTTIKVDPENPKYDSRDNCNAIIDTSSKTLIVGCKNTIIPDGVINIGFSAFFGCTGLTSITIPNSVTSIGSSAFQGCASLSSISFPNTIDYIHNMTFADCTSLSSFVIPNSVSTIDYSAFSGCSKLSSITIPNRVKGIYEFAFEGCSNLTSVTVEKKIPMRINDYGSFPYRTNATLYVPIGSKTAYQTADFWKDFKTIIEKDLDVNSLLGDVNGDDETNISDVTKLVDYLLERVSSGFVLANADVNNDGKITNSDVVSIIKLIHDQALPSQGHLTCPDDNHPHMIDLGLPSGTKWACCNVGSSTPEEHGTYYDWGETEYDMANSSYVGSSIIGTQYDVAHVQWGDKWNMGSNFSELLFNCTYEWINVNGCDGAKLVSKINGGSIFLPSGKYHNGTQYISIFSDREIMNEGANCQYISEEPWFYYVEYEHGLVRPVTK